MMEPNNNKSRYPRVNIQTNVETHEASRAENSLPSWWRKSTSNCQRLPQGNPQRERERAVSKIIEKNYHKS